MEHKVIRLVILSMPLSQILRESTLLIDKARELQSIDGANAFTDISSAIANEDAKHDFGNTCYYTS